MRIDTAMELLDWIKNPPQHNPILVLVQDDGDTYLDTSSEIRERNLITPDNYYWDHAGVTAWCGNGCDIEDGDDHIVQDIIQAMIASEND